MRLALAPAGSWKGKTQSTESASPLADDVTVDVIATAATATDASPAVGARRGRGRRFLGRLITTVMLAIALLVLGGGIAIRVNGLRLQTVLTGSMVPVASPGDIAVTQPVPVGSVQTGDVIAFYPPGEGLPVLHRIQTLDAVGGVTSVTTKGDANRVADPWGAVQLQGSTAYRLVAVVPFIGWLAEYKGLLFIAAGVLVGIGLVQQIWRELKLRRPSPAA